MSLNFQPQQCFPEPVLVSHTFQRQGPTIFHDETKPHNFILRLKCLLRQPLRVTTVDGRIFLGTFAGTDQLLNIVVINAEEYRLDCSAGKMGRYVGQVMIPWRWILTVEAPCEGNMNRPQETEENKEFRGESYVDLYL